MALKGVFFDAGETLIHPVPSFPALFARVVGEAGFEREPGSVEAAVGTVARRFDEVARYDPAWSTSPERSRAFWSSIYAGFLRELDIPDDGEMRSRLYSTFSDPANYGLFQDAMPAIESLHRGGFRMGVISNFEAWLDHLLTRLGLDVYLPVRAISGLEGVQKPDPALFQVALARAGLEPTECAYVGDNPAFDVEPAAELGMLAVLIDRHDRHPGSPHPRIASLAELPAMVGS